jgi:hypothetical protein
MRTGANALNERFPQASSDIQKTWGARVIRKKLYPAVAGKFKVARTNPILLFSFAAFSYF